MKILFENENCWVVQKPAGIVSESLKGQGLADRLAELNNGYAGVIHRLDREVSGLMLYAKNAASAAHYSEAARQKLLKKEYLALVAGHWPESEGELKDYLFYDRRKNKVFTVRRKRTGVKEAVLRYHVECYAELPGIGPVSLISVDPVTGRTHQIRVQFASRGHAVIGDRRYGGLPLPPTIERGQILLACSHISVPDIRGQEQSFVLNPDWIHIVK